MSKVQVLLGSWSDYTKGNAVSPGFVKDLHIFGSLSVERLCDVLERMQQTFLYEDAKSIIAEFAGNESEALWRIFECISSAGYDEFIEMLAEIRSSSFASEVFSSTMWEQINGNSQVIQKYFPLRCIERRLVLERLQILTGNLFQHADVICDIRPIFDPSTASIVDLVPLITLKIGYCTQTEDDKVMEIVLSEEHLDDLSAKIEVAKKKLDVLSDISFANKGQAKQLKE